MKSFLFLLFSIRQNNLLKTTYNYNIDFTNMSDGKGLDTLNEYDLNAKEGVCGIKLKNDNDNLDKIIDIYYKSKLLKRLLSENISIYEKLELIEKNEIIKENDILEDWNNIF